VSLPRVLAVALFTFAAVPLGAQPRLDQLRIIAPAAPGGGWDQLARVIEGVLQREGLVGAAPVENIPGAAGTIGLARFISAEQANGRAVMVTGLVMLGAIVSHASPVTLSQVTPLARLVGEYEAVVVSAQSPFGSLRDLLDAFRARPESISWAGGSAGGTDQILAGLIAQAAGVAPHRINYIAFSGGGESLAAILGQQVSAGIGGLAEFEGQVAAGALRVLAVSSAERLKGFDAPTLREQGVEVALENWRALVAPPGVSRGDLERLEALTEAMVRTDAWRAALARYRWSDAYLAGDAFRRFLRDEEARVRAVVTRLDTGGNKRTGTAIPPYAFLVLGGLMLTGLLTALELSRTSKLRLAPPASGWRPIALLAAGIVLDLALLERAGFMLASAALFWFTALALDRRRPFGDALFAFAVSLACFLLFDRVLELPLPSGLLERYL
jgi:putative tricarboxylic transport membrane protein